jgi:3-oxoacyl-[acyl-carrier-protein] synthase III
MSNNTAIGLRGLGCALPERFAPLAEIPLRSRPEALAGFGFTGAFLADDVHDLAVTAAQRALVHAALEPGEVGALLCAHALSAAHQRVSTLPDGGVLDTFCYSASWLQEELGLDQASVSGIAQQGCAGMFSALRMARALLVAEPQIEHILCVGADALPAGACREILYNVISDAACAVVVSRNRIQYRWLAFHQLSKGYYWDVPAKQSEIIAAYFPSARVTIEGTLRQAKLRPEEIDVVIPTGVNASSWPILLRLCGIPEERLYQPKARFGHTIAADSILLLQEAAQAGVLIAGMRVLLFAYGFGSSWCALVVEVAGEVRS